VRVLRIVARRAARVRVLRIVARRRACPDLASALKLGDGAHVAQTSSSSSWSAKKRAWWPHLQERTKSAQIVPSSS
jgi:hypothetical protein